MDAFTAQDTHFLAAYAAAYRSLAAAPTIPAATLARLTRLAADADAERAALPPPSPSHRPPPPPSPATVAYTDFLAAAVGSSGGGSGGPLAGTPSVTPSPTGRAVRDGDTGGAAGGEGGEGRPSTTAPQRLVSAVPAAAAVAALVPCMRLYAHLGRTLTAAARDGGPGGGVPAYASWLAVYAGAPFATAATEAEAALDEWVAAAGAGGELEAAAAALYERAMELEVAFFDEAWRGIPGLPTC
ncbi:hypothetical protein MMPV_004167 [Pyropia vietnamensis]